MVQRIGSTLRTWLKLDATVVREHADLQARGFIAELILQVCTRIGSAFRRRRMARFEQQFPTAGYLDIVDVGGTFEFWQGSERNVTIVNPHVPPKKINNHRSIQGDGRDLPFHDKQFKLAFSNSAIEHVPVADQERFASELSRIGVAVYCQTPNRWFPYDTHYIALFWHWWPRLLRDYYVVRYLTGWGWTFKPNRQAVQDWADVVHLMGYKRIQSLFPDCFIEREKCLWMTKSFIAVRRME